MTNNLEIFLAKDIKEVLKLLSQKDSCIIAGGTDVIPGVNQGSKRFSNVNLLIDLNNVPQLKGISIEGDKITIGAAETFSNLLKSDVIKKHLPLLWKSASTIGSIQIRNRATVAGNFVNNAPCADSIPPLLVYNAEIEIKSQKSKRVISLGEFLNSPYKTKIEGSEVVTRIIVHVPHKDFVGDFYKLGRRRAVAISRITLALLIKMNSKVIEEVRIASGAVTPIGTRFFELEKFALGKTLNEEMMKELSRKTGEKIIEVTGLRWSSEYKLPVVQQMMYQMLNQIEHGLHG